LLGADAWDAGALGFFSAEANAINVRSNSNTDHFGRTFFPRLLEFIATPVRCEALSFLINPPAGNIGSQKDFGLPAIPLMGFFDESF